MVWMIGAICMIVFGAAGVAIGVFLPSLSSGIVGGILFVAGILLLVAYKRSGGPLSRNL